jgi:hypothetical protein
MVRFPSLPLLAMLLTLEPGVGPVHAQEPIALGSRRELFVDASLIDTLINARLELHRPHREGTAVQFDLPWEGAFSGYVAVLDDSGLYRMYYRGLPRVSTQEESPAVVCYAESRDGIAWTKPVLGLYEVGGTRENNIVLADARPFCSNFTPFLDSRPGVPVLERFKALAGNETTGLVAFVSGDGIHWSKFRDEPVLRDGMFDSQNVAFWSDHEQMYVCYFRTWTGEGYTGFRTISRSTSKDFLNWTETVPMSFGNTPQEHLYTNATIAYGRAPHIYLAFPKRFFPDKAALLPEEAEELVEDPKYRLASSDAVFMSSRGGTRYDRTFMEAFIRPGPTLRDWVARDNTPALGILQNGERELFLYRMSHYAQATSHVTRYSLRVDGFVSVSAPYAGGELLSRPITFSGRALEINFASSAAGGVKIEIQDAGGMPLPGFTLTECPEMIGDRIQHTVFWEGGSDLSALAGRPVRLRVVLRDAELYSFRFH